MLKKLLNYLEDKKIVILGFGIEGESSYRFLRKHFPEKKLFVADKNLNLLENKPELMDDMDLEVSVGNNYLNGIEEYDIILKAPGISLKNVDISKWKNKITSQLQLFLEFVNIFTIGITGTKGKSTTSSLMYKVLMEQNKDAYLLGNIGEPIFNDIDMFSENSIAVIEVSSHALEFVNNSPNIAILLDIFEEHLDYYKSLEKYIEAKFNIAKYQNDNDYFIYNYDSKLMSQWGFKYKENDCAISINNVPNSKNKVFLENNFIYYDNGNSKEILMSIDEKMELKGMHNINNIMFILAVCEILKLDVKLALKTIKGFKPLEHRMEFVGTFDGIDYYNDSIATIPESTMDAVKSIKNVNTIIVGGKDRGIDLSEFIEFLQKSEIENIICLPKTGEYIYEKLKDINVKLNKEKIILKNIKYTESLKEAVEYAKKVTKKGTVCLLSPAASSYGYFKNFEERGKLYKQYVQLGTLV